MTVQVRPLQVGALEEVTGCAVGAMSQVKFVESGGRVGAGMRSIAVAAITVAASMLGMGAPCSW